MTTRVLVIFTGVMAVGLISCSEERKREAARLERMLSGDTVAQIDSSYSTILQDSSPVVQYAEYLTDSAMEAPIGADTGVDRTATEQTAVTLIDQVTVEPMAADVPPDTVPDINAIPEEAAVSRPTMPRRPVGESFTVQVGSAVTLVEARALVTKLENDGYQPYIATVTVNDRDHYRIRVGRLPTSDEAMRLKDELATKYAIEPWIDKISE
ncbi:MAG: SPOR domain-containing protein [Candidatus Zixiibacteriota bacterium]